ncbi:MAG: NAD(P)/FAD-dependent oxidoreductase [Candidatus Abyssobacteria bacterium SURF_17]|uniref:NAD(P)/FAD-dependent oxidoreductase n=1 Tax=Candidatus Abyssobacteria bacterium SURF_17 TaxID=2093361 RepID=A0A419EUT7_9BACT|nr:MAG: NAD(P)/FAD-dependent oxidoreductase [Candidatus Abyssubacteria bacterium SURF_17]
MADATFDAVIIGAGHNGLALGCYLAKSGWSVGIFEKRHEEGGGLCTEELTRPGFLHNVHSNYHTLVGVSPVYDDLNLFAHGLKYVHPPVQMGSVFSDGTALTIHKDMSKTYAAMARFSQKDADTWMRLYEEVKGFLDLLVGTLMFAPPINLNEITNALTVWGVEDKSEFLRARLRSMTINDFLNQHFENEKIKTMLAFHAAVCAYSNDVRGLAISFPLLAGKIDNWQCCIGGSHKLAHALWWTLLADGGVVYPASPVVKILTKNERAVGVKLQDGTEVEARKLVASNVDVEQTFLRFLDGDIRNKLFVDNVKDCKHKDWTLFSVHLAMNEPPQYLAADFDPDINQAWVMNAGYETLADLNDDFTRIRRGELVDPKLNCAVNSLFDPTDAPPGKYTGLLRQFAPFQLNGSEDEWDRVKVEYSERCIRKWREYAPNLDEDAIIAYAPYTPKEISDRLVNMVRGDWMLGDISPDNLLSERPFRALSQYRTPVKALYMCGSTQHPHGYITFAPAYNALQVIADDYGIDKWWKRV